MVFEWVRQINRQVSQNTLDAAAAASALAAWESVDTVLGVGAPAEIEAPDEVRALLDERQAARRAGDFKRADVLREALKSKGWVIEDTPKGARLKRA